MCLQRPLPNCLISSVLTFCHRRILMKSRTKSMDKARNYMNAINTLWLLDISRGYVRELIFLRKLKSRGKQLFDWEGALGCIGSTHWSMCEGSYTRTQALFHLFVEQMWRGCDLRLGTSMSLLRHTFPKDPKTWKDITSIIIRLNI